jgi:hypothetical protein
MLLTGAALSNIGDEEPSGIAFLFELYHNQDITEVALSKLRWAVPHPSDEVFEKAFGSSFCGSTSKGFTFMTRAGIRDPTKKTFREHLTCALAANDIQVLFREIFEKALQIAQEYDTTHEEGDIGAILYYSKDISQDWNSFESTVVQTVANSANPRDNLYSEYYLFIQDVHFEQFSE